jgi:hypothetical protein
VGRPLKKIDPEKVRELAIIGCTVPEIATMLGCDPQTIRNRFSAIVELGDVQGKIQIRRKQHVRAVKKGSDSMLQFLGKHRLGQTDRLEADLSLVDDHLDDAINAPTEAHPGAPEVSE